jgi:hypothetical protein
MDYMYKLAEQNIQTKCHHVIAGPSLPLTQRHTNWRGKHQTLQNNLNVGVCVCAYMYVYQ